MLARLGVILNALARRWVPDPFVLAIGLTLVASLLALPRLVSPCSHTFRLRLLFTTCGARRLVSTTCGARRLLFTTCGVRRLLPCAERALVVY